MVITLQTERLNYEILSEGFIDIIDIIYITQFSFIQCYRILISINKVLIFGFILCTGYFSILIKGLLCKKISLDHAGVNQRICLLHSAKMARYFPACKSS